MSTDKIFIDALEVDAILGIYDWEREVPQRILLDIVMEWNIRKAAESGRIEDTLDYSAVADRVSVFIQEQKFQLIESLVEACAHLVMDEFAVPWIHVRCKKTNVMPNTSGVGVEITRSQVSLPSTQ